MTNEVIRLIDANALHKEVTSFDHSVIYKDWVQSAIASAPTISDVAPVVRCKDCKYFTKGPYVFDNSKCWCACWYDSVKDDDFCSYGAKKDLEDKS